MRVYTLPVTPKASLIFISFHFIFLLCFSIHSYVYLLFIFLLFTQCFVQSKHKGYRVEVMYRSLTFYTSKKMVRVLGFNSEKVDASEQNKVSPNIIPLLFFKLKTLESFGDRIVIIDLV